MPLKSLLLSASVFASLFLPPHLIAQKAGVGGVAELEIRRQEMTRDFASEAVRKGNRAMEDHDYESAYAYYKSAVDALPSGGSEAAELREEALSGLAQACVKLAEQRISEGRYEDAELTLLVILDNRYDPNYGPALKLLEEIRSPDHFNKTITPGFVANVEEVKQLLREADGFYQSGRYDLAFKRCEQVLNIDKYNIAARRLMEKVNNARADYADHAYNETRAELLTDVTAAWELPVTQYDVGTNLIIEQPVLDIRGTNAINRKLDEIRIPTINFRETTIREALDFLKQRSRDLDVGEPDPNSRGINIVLKLDPGMQAAEAGQRITLSLTDVPLREALNFVATAANLKTKVAPYAVEVVPLSTPTDVLLTKEYKVPPGFLSNLPAPSDTGGGGGSIFDQGGATAEADTVGRTGVKEFLESQGVQFPDGASANYLPSSSRLIVRNTQANLELIDQLIDVTTVTPSQVEIEAKFVEVSQNNLKELGFDWLLGQFALPFGTGVYGGGGTTGFTGAVNPLDYPLALPRGGSGADVTNLPIGATDLNSGPLTAGNRSGTTAISANAIDGLLFAGPAGPAPGVLALAGVFTNPQFQVVLRALSQQKGVDLLSAPKVTTKSGQRATIQLIREFRYPVQFDPPQVPQSTGSNQQFLPIPPTSPTEFETRNIGVELEVEPTVGPDGFTIDLNLSPRVTEFDGFINYGSPISAYVEYTPPGVVALGSTVSGTFQISENVINQPVFSIRQVTTQVTVYDGQTVVLGGLMREDIQKVEDKTPILGDIPFVGRLFRTSADQHIKRNLIMFVTAVLLDPAGQPLLKTIEEDEIVAAPDPEALSAEEVPGDPLTSPNL